MAASGYLEARVTYSPECVEVEFSEVGISHLRLLIVDENIHRLVSSGGNSVGDVIQCALAN